MTIPQSLQHSHELYPSLLFLPVDQQSVIIRPGAAKEDKGILSRMEEAAAAEIALRSMEEQEKLKQYLGTNEAVIPIPFHRHKRLFPELLRPEMFLYEEVSSQRGIPLSLLKLYKKTPASLTPSQMEKHIAAVTADYFFAAEIAAHNREFWLETVDDAYSKHSFIQLAAEKQHVTAAVENMNKSALLGLLKYPEDIAYWRHRVEIVLRPYRAVPRAWRWEPCNHEKTLSLASESGYIQLTCEECHFSVYLRTADKALLLPEEINLYQAVKRIATIERQFNEIAQQNNDVIEKILRLQRLKQEITKYEENVLPIIDLQEKLPENAGISMPPIIQMYREMKKINIPARTQNSLLLWMAEIDIPNVSIFHQLQEWEALQSSDWSSELNEARKELELMIEETRPQPTDQLAEVKGFSVTRETNQKILRFLEIQEQEISLHVLVQVLKGQPTNKVRSLSYHETELFALLSEWPEKFITKAVLQLEKRGHLAKGKRGYAAFTEEMEENNYNSALL